MPSLNAPTRSHLENADNVIRQIRNRLQKKTEIPYLWHEYENDISRLLDAFLPHCVLRSARLFTPSFLNENDFGLEVDNMLHIRNEEVDYLVLVETKNQPVTVENGNWIVRYSSNQPNNPTVEKDVRQQIQNHILALHEYLHPVSRNVSLKIIYFVVSNQSKRAIETATGHRNAELVLLGYDQLVSQLATRLGLDPNASAITGDPRRIAQSEFLDLLRLGHAHPHLGHPEISAAIRYVERCRRELDQGLFKLLKPSEDRWLINGSAGMGKSVLLAYTAAVISCGHELYKFQGETGIKKADEIMERTKCAEARLVIAANSQKQLDSLQYWFNRFVEDFQEVAQGRDLFFRRPKFLLFDQLGTLLIDGIPWSAVFLDEAHDLSDQAAHKLKQASEKLGFYLVAACDRHQRIMDSGADTKVIPGFNFSGKYLRLKQIYRNPAPIYIASLGLMFRWFSAKGPKVLPTDSELRTNFGFETLRLNRQSVSLTLKTDAHPGNSWSHSVARFSDAASVAGLLRRERLNRDEVLWVRFSKEDRSFDYEGLHRDFTYHNCRTSEAVDLNDKYIKGQEYPVVVIEGFPGLMDRYADDEAHVDAAKRMWKFRREIYLCASRATCFLLFVCNDSSSDEFERIDQELNSLLQAISTPNLSANGGNGVRTWGFRIDTTGCEVIAPRDYGDLVRSDTDVSTPATPAVEHASPRSTITTPSPGLSALDLLIYAAPEIGEPKPPLQREPAHTPGLSTFDSLIDAAPEIAEPTRPLKKETPPSPSLSALDLLIDSAPEIGEPNPPLQKVTAPSPGLLAFDSLIEAAPEIAIQEPQLERITPPSHGLASFDALIEAASPHPNPESLGSSTALPIRPRSSPVEDSIDIAPSYPDWPIPEAQIPSYEFVILAEEPASVSDFAHTLGIDVPDLLRSLRKRGLSFATNTRIPLETMRSLAFEFECYPAATEEEYAALREEDAEEIEEIPTAPLNSRSSLPKDSKIEVAKREALNLFAKENKPTVKRPNIPPTEVIGSISKILDHADPIKGKMPNTPVSATESSKRITTESLTDDPKHIVIKSPILVPELAARLGLKPFNVMADLIKLEIFPTPNQPIAPKVAAKVCEMHGFTLERQNRTR